MLQYLHIFSDRLLNETKFGFNRGNVYTTNQGLTGLPYTVAVSGFTTLNKDQFKLGVGNSYSFVDTLTWVRGAHTLKFGGEARRIQLNQGNTASGAISYASAAAFAANQVSSASYAAELPINGLRKTAVYAFAQDEWRWHPNLTFNLGVRYSFFNRFHEVLDRANSLRLRHLRACHEPAPRPRTRSLYLSNRRLVDPVLDQSRGLCRAICQRIRHAGTQYCTGLGLWQSDLGLARHIPTTEQLQLEFRTEFFNLFNRSQYGLPLADLSSSGSFGQIIAPVNPGPVWTGTPRQIQFLLRMSF